MSWFIVIPGHWVSQFFVVSSPNVEPLLGVEEDALGHSLKVAAELAQHVATSLVDYSQVNEPTGTISVEEGVREGRGMIREMWYCTSLLINSVSKSSKTLFPQFSNRVFPIALSNSLQLLVEMQVMES